jgi:hypothetical protein
VTSTARQRAEQELAAIKANSRYLFDKLLHNDYVLEPERRHPKINLNL